MHITRTRKNSYRKRLILSIITLLLTVSCFITVSYAWFTNSAFSKGNKVFAGNLMVDVLISEDDLKANLIKSEVISEGDNLPDTLNSFKYERELDDGDIQTYYYASRIPATIDEDPIDTSILRVENVEPGQAIRVKVNIVNSGDLALQAAGAIRVEEGKSLTGIQTFLDEHPDIETILSNENTTDGTTPTGKASTNSEIYFLNTLLSMQATNWGKPEGASAIGGKYFKDNGGHLEDVLCVYLLEDVGDGDLNFDREALDDELENLEQDERFFGTLKQFQYMLEYGANPSEENKNTYMELWGINPYENKNVRSLGDIESDYQRYLDYASGYCLPQAEMIDSNNKIPSEGKSVTVKGADGKVLYTRKGVSEIETINFLLYMPREAGDEYQNASISLSLGATASQVEYEKDDTGYMIYDMSGHNNSHISNGCSIKINGSGNTVITIEIAKDTEINFDAGEHGSYTTNPGPITVSDMDEIYDFTGNEYIPDNIEANYLFNGFEFDEASSTLTAQYKDRPTPPNVSELIIIDGKDYRVLEINENIAKLLAMYDVSKSKIREFSDTTSFGEETGEIYENSIIDKYLEESFYQGLSFKDKIIPQNISQSYYNMLAMASEGWIKGWGKDNFNSSTEENDADKIYYIKNAGIIGINGTRNCYLLDVDDVLSYLDLNNGEAVTPQQLNEMFFNVDNSIDETNALYYRVWLRSTSGLNYFRYVDGGNGTIDGHTFNQELGVRPAFVVDLTNVDYEVKPLE